MLLPELQTIVFSYQREFERFPKRLLNVKHRLYNIYLQASALQGLFHSHFGYDRFCTAIREGMCNGAKRCIWSAALTYEALCENEVLSPRILGSLGREEAFINSAKKCPERWVCRVCDLALLEGEKNFDPNLTTLEDIQVLEFRSN